MSARIRSLGKLRVAGLAGLAGALLFACNTDPGTKQQTVLRLKLNDSLSRYDKIVIYIMDLADTSHVLEKVWSQELPPGTQIPEYTLSAANEGRQYYVKIQGFVQVNVGGVLKDELVLETQIRTVDGVKTVIHVPLPSPPPRNQLSHLEPSTGGTLEPAFNKDSLTYLVKMQEGVGTVTFVVKSDNIKAVVTVQGDTVKVNVPPRVFTVGTNPDTVVVSVIDWGVARNYTLIITPPVKAKLRLTSLTFSAGTLDPPFDPETSTYQLNVPNNIDTVTATMIPADLATTMYALGARTGREGNPFFAPFTSRFCSPLPFPSFSRSRLASCPRC